jgi:30S ribosomal protein S31
MGRGDKKTKKGKIFKGSFGKSRPAKPGKKVIAGGNDGCRYGSCGTSS